MYSIANAQELKILNHTILLIFSVTIAELQSLYIFDDWPGEVTPMFATKAAITMTTVTNSTVYRLQVLSGHKSSFCYNLSYSFQMSLGKPGYQFILSAYFLSIFQERLKSTVIHNLVRR